MENMQSYCMYLTHPVCLFAVQIYSIFRNNHENEEKIIAPHRNEKEKATLRLIWKERLDCECIQSSLSFYIMHIERKSTKNQVLSKINHFHWNSVHFKEKNLFDFFLFKLR